MVSTPLDLQKRKEFRKKFRGYSAREVDNFINRVVKDYEQIYKENQEHQEQRQDLTEQLGQYELIEDTLQKTLVLAQETADEVRKNAEKEAALIIEKARLHGEKMILMAEERVDEVRREYERLRQLEIAYRTQLKSFFEAQLLLLEGKLDLEIGVETEEVEDPAGEVDSFAEVAVSIDADERTSLGL